MDARLEQLLRAEREVQPDADAERRIWQAVEHRLAHGPPPPSGAEVVPGAAGGASGVALKIVAGIALVAGAVGVWAARGDRGAPPEPAPVVAVGDVPKDMSEKTLPPVPPAPAVVAVPEVAPAPEVTPAAAPEEPPAETGKKRPRARVKPEVEAPPDEPADFAAEMQLIAEIRGALKRGDSAGALARVEEHARRFGARGQLVQERLAYQVEALCAAGRVADARRVAGDLLGRWPDSTHAPRVKSSCAGA